MKITISWEDSQMLVHFRWAPPTQEKLKWSLKAWEVLNSENSELPVGKLELDKNIQITNMCLKWKSFKEHNTLRMKDKNVGKEI